MAILSWSAFQLPVNFSTRVMWTAGFHPLRDLQLMQEGKRACKINYANLCYLISIQLHEPIRIAHLNTDSDESCKETSIWRRGFRPGPTGFFIQSVRAFSKFCLFPCSQATWLRAILRLICRYISFNVWCMFTNNLTFDICSQTIRCLFAVTFSRRFQGAKNIAGRLKYTGTPERGGANECLTDPF